MVLATLMGCRSFTQPGQRGFPITFGWHNTSEVAASAMCASVNQANYPRRENSLTGNTVLNVCQYVFCGGS
jgi:hypothetical protein